MKEKKDGKYGILHATKWPELKYTNQAPGLWRYVFVDYDDHGRESVTGEQYPTKAALLLDMDAMARVYGLLDTKVSDAETINILRRQIIAMGGTPEA